MTDWFDLDEHDERTIAAFMSRVASLPVPEAETQDSGLVGRIPDPGSRIPGAQDPARLWWKAQLLKKWEAERRAQRPLDVMHPIEIAGGLVAAGLMLYWSLPYLF
jgi:hypothetical protein